MKIKRNMGAADQVVRAGLGAALIYVGPFAHVLTSDFMSGLLLGFVGLLTSVASVFGYCPLYDVAGICTYKANATNE